MARDNKAGTILGFLVGIGIGAAAVLLLAPQAGDELRDNITDAVGDSIDQLRDRTRILPGAQRSLLKRLKNRCKTPLTKAPTHIKQAKKAGA